MTGAIAGIGPQADALEITVFGAARAWACAVLMVLIGMINMIDRALPGVLVEPIKHELHLSDTALGLINGFGFLLVYSVMGIPIARLADRGAYGLVISSCVALWSLMTLLGAFAHSGWQLAFTRMGVALGEAGNTPAAHAFIARNFAPEARAAPLSVLSLSVPIAIILGIAGGRVGALFGWRATFAAMGVVGLCLAPLVLLALGPRQGLGSRTAHSPRRALREGFALLAKRSLRLILLASGSASASACIGIGGYALATFALAFLMRSHRLPLASASLDCGLTAGIIGIVGVLTMGLLANRLAERDPRWLVVMMAAGLLPCSFAALLVHGASASLILLALANLISTAYLPPVVAAIQRLVSADMRATASAMLLLFTALAGGAGPLLVGMMSDALAKRWGAAALGHAMLLVPVTQAAAALLYFLAARSYRQELIDAH